MRRLYTRYHFLVNQIEQQLSSSGIMVDVSSAMVKYLGVPNTPVGPYRRFVSVHHMKQLVNLAELVRNDFPTLLNVVLQVSVR